MKKDREAISLFLCGDVMTGRGIDQILPHPSDPRLFESYVKDARDYVRLAEQKNGPIPRGVPFSYIWGDALPVLEGLAPDGRLINLETAVTTSDSEWKGKGINYRMHPGNVPCLAAAEIDVCALANNHVLDWGYEGLTETLKSLREANLKIAGAGENAAEAFQPAILEVETKGRIVIFSFGMKSSGIPAAWAVSDKSPGVNVVDNLNPAVLAKIRTEITSAKQAGDVLVVSVHWGGNWGYQISPEQKDLAHWLIDEGGVDIVHGHSSHHPKGIEIYRNKPIFYGCGDFINDYEGISGYEAFRDDLTLMYIVWMEPGTGKLVRIEMIPMQIRKFRLNHTTKKGTEWLFQTMERECRRMGVNLKREKDDVFSISC